MKYLREYYAFALNSEYYKEVSSDEFIQKMKVKAIDPVKLAWIQDFCHQHSLRLGGDNHLVLITARKTDWWDMNIYQCEDDWFMVKDDSRWEAGRSGTAVYYACDQWDGLMQFLHDKYKNR